MNADGTGVCQSATLVIYEFCVPHLAAVGGVCGVSFGATQP